MKDALQGVASRVRSLGSAVSLSPTGRGGGGGSPVEALQVMASYRKTESEGNRFYA